MDHSLIHGFSLPNTGGVLQGEVGDGSYSPAQQTDDRIQTSSGGHEQTQSARGEEETLAHLLVQCPRLSALFGLLKTLFRGLGEGFSLSLFNFGQKY